MIDFTNAIEQLNSYRGSEKKKTLIYNNKKYLVKFPDPVREKNKNISYINNAFSEYVGSNIFKLIGFKTQNTELGVYEYGGKKKIVCACEDFTDDDNVLYEFENLVLSTNPDKKIETELNDIIDVIKESKMINTEETIEKFWDMFIVDSLIGNTDRHNGNWGFLYNANTDEVSLAPVFDCGSSLYPQADESIMQAVLNDKNELNHRVFDMPLSAITYNGKKINYFKFISAAEFAECNEALKRITSRIDMEKIFEIIDSTPSITELQKDFYKVMLSERKEHILDFSLLNLQYK